MAIYQFPGTDYHDLNLDWLLTQMKNLLAEMGDLQTDYTSYKTQIDARVDELEQQIADYLAAFDARLPVEVQTLFNAYKTSDEFANFLIQTLTADSGDGSALGDIVSTWLAAHITQETGYVIDDTLTVAGAAADAKAVGDILAEYNPIPNTKLAFNQRKAHCNIIKTIIQGGYINANTGNVTSSSTLCYADYMEVTPGHLYYCNNISTNYGAFYDEDKVKVAETFAVSSSTIQVPNNSDIKYMRVSFNTENASLTAFICDINIIPTAYRDELYSTAFDIIADKTVTDKKISFIKHDPDTNFIDYDFLYEGKYINSAGKMVNGSNTYCTPFLEIVPNTVYYLIRVVPIQCAWYDEDFAFIQSINTTTSILTSPTAFTAPVTAKYIRVSVPTTSYNAHNAVVSTNSGIPFDAGLAQDYIKDQSDRINPCDYRGSDISTFNKIACIGDSLTYGFFNHDTGTTLPTGYNEKYSYPSQLKKITGVDTVNLGVSGITTPSWYTRYANEDLSGFDCAIIALGVNDVSELGGFTEDVQTAYTNIITKLKTENPQIHIFISTIFHSLSYGSTRTYSDALATYIEGLNDPYVILLDMNLYDHLAESGGYNAGHLSAYGYWKLAQDFKSYISWYMFMHKDIFRFVQFTGSDSTYT